MAKLGGHAVCIAAFLPALCHAHFFQFLEQQLADAERISIEAVGKGLPSEFAGIPGQSSPIRTSHIQTQLRPMCTALPETNDGALSTAVERNALHRFFMQQHAWHEQGLAPDGNSWNKSSPPTMLKDWWPSHVFALVEQQMGGHGVGLHELVVLAATLDDVTHHEVSFAEFVASTFSDTVDLSRNLSVALLERLNEIAGQNDGKGPLLGHIFAQWLQHAYPRECPGSSSSPVSNEGSSDDTALPEKEELVTIHEEPAARSKLLRNLAGFAVLASAAISLYQTAKSALATLLLSNEYCVAKSKLSQYYLAACKWANLCLAASKLSSIY